MNVLASIWGRFGDHRSATVIAQDIDEELATHLDFLRDECLAQGMSPEEAEAEAHRRFGDARACREACIAISKGWSLMWFRLSVALNVIFVVGLLGAALLAERQAVAARRSAEVAMAQARIAIDQLQAAGDASRFPVRGATSGTVHVEGKVGRPGEYGVSLASPRSLRELITMAGGPTADATTVSVRRAGGTSEETQTLDDLYRSAPGEGDPRPGPGDVVILR
jgi:hypothetical protein